MKRFAFLSLFLVTSIAAWSQPAPRLSPWPWQVSGTAICTLSLNGSWTFETPGIQPSPISVPSEWTMEGFDVAEGETAHYSRRFDIPADWIGKRIKIRFDGVSSHGQVKVNGRTVGEHEGGMVPFELDITEAAQSGENAIEVDVRAWTASDRLGCVSQYAVHTVGGLVRKVTLYALPETNIASIDAVTRLDRSYNKNATLDIVSSIAYETGTAQQAEIEYILTDAAGKEEASAKAKPGTNNEAKASLTVRNARLWNPEQPYLYELTTTLRVAGKVVQTNKQRVGLRQVEIKGNILLVNGQPVKLHGVNRHETHPLRGRSLTPELCRLDAELFRNGNCNYVRTSHYPPSEEFLDACDELGLFVESEAALTWIQHHASPIWKTWNYTDEKFLPYMVRANMDNVVANRRHPSIIIWSLGNESRWSPLWEQVLETVKQLDPSRPTALHDQCWGGFNNAGSKADIANYHYPGINGPAACDTMSRPTLFGEYAHISCYNRTELIADPGIRAAYGEPLMQMYDSMYVHPACLGGAIWSGIDDTFHLPDGRIVGYGPWGVIDGWRRPKPEYEGMKKAYAPVRILNATWKNGRDGYTVTLTVENRYDFTNLKDVKLLIDGKETAVKADIPPHTTGTIRFSTNQGMVVMNSGNSGAMIPVAIKDPRGFICKQVCVLEHEGSEFAGLDDRKPLAPQVSEDDASITVSYGDSYRFVFSKVTGLMTHATNDVATLLTQGPVFCIVPMSADDGGKPNVAGETYQNNIYPDKVYPLYTLFATNVTTDRPSDKLVTVSMDATYLDGSAGKLTYEFKADGDVELHYQITVGEETRPSQYGMLFRLPVSMNKLIWQSHFRHPDPGAPNIISDIFAEREVGIDRTSGVAYLDARPVYEVEEWGVEPAGQWKDDANTLGSVDFRSTKRDIVYVSLNQVNRGLGLHIVGQNGQDARAWLQDGHIQLLVADYTNTGSEPFYGTPFTSDRIKLEKGQVIKGSVAFSIY